MNRGSSDLVSPKRLLEGRRAVMVACLFLLLQGCVSQTSVEVEESPGSPIFEPIRPRVHEGQEQEPEIGPGELQTRSFPTPRVSVDDVVAELFTEDLGAGLEGESIRANYNNLPIPVFINEIFGERLGLSFTLSPELSKQGDLVTLRITEPVTPSELFRVARTTLEAYGISIDLEGELLVFTADESRRLSGQTPLLISGRTLPEVPDSQRPIFMFVPLEVVSNNNVKQWLDDFLRGQDLIIKADIVRNAIVLQGKPRDVEQALAIIKSLDRPLMRGKFSVAVEPAYVQVEDLAMNLENVLESEGIDASLKPPLGSVILLPLEGSNKLVIFASTQQMIDHVQDWVATIDRKEQEGVSRGIFSYRANNTQAQNIVDMLVDLEAGSEDEDSPTGRFVVDENRNAIVFQGSGPEWLELLPVIEDMDEAAPSVLIEVLLVEVTLSDSETTGFEFLSRGAVTVFGRSYESVFGTLGRLGVGGSGFSAVLDSAGETRAILNLFYENNLAEIRSRPRLLVKSGQEANIEVGTEIPVVVGQEQSTESPGTPVIQDVQYRKTGVSLRIKPVVHASGFVDISVDQTLSEALPTTSGENPSIFNREIQTVATLRDGGSLVLGGLISRTESRGLVGVPVLSRIPWLGRLFSNETVSSSRTELLVMIIPYVITGPDEGETLTEELVDRLRLLTESVD